MSLFDVDNEEINPRLKGLNVYLSGEFDLSKSIVKRKLEDLASIKVVTELTRDTRIIVTGKNPPSEDDRKRIELLWDGYNIAHINIDTYEDLSLWVKKELLCCDNWCNLLSKGKKLNITYDALFNSTYSPVAHLSLEEDLNRLKGKEIFMHETADDCFLCACLNDIDATIVHSFSPEKTYLCLLREETIEKLKKGEKDYYIKEIEDKYNLSSCEKFLSQFLLKDELMRTYDSWKQKHLKENSIESIENQHIGDISTQTNENEETICHYTDINALVSILQKGKIVFRATNILYLNDTKETTEGLEVVNDIIEKQRVHSNHLQVLKTLKSKFEELQSDLFEDFYVTSFCKHKNDLIMWAMYADDGRGCALEFSLEKIQDEFNKKDYYQFLSCVYGKNNAHTSYKKEVQKNVKEWVDAKVNSDKDKEEEMFQKLIENTFCYSISTKNDVFKSEGEYRGIYHYVENKGGNVKYRVKSNYVVPYVEIELSVDVLKQIILGPNTNELTLKSVENLLRINGYTGVTVAKSILPYRG